MAQTQVVSWKKFFAIAALILFVLAAASTFANIQFGFLPWLTLPLWIVMLICYGVAKLIERQEKRKALEPEAK